MSEGYGQLPEIIGHFPWQIKEMMFYQYLPIKVANDPLADIQLHSEPRLHVFNAMIGASCCDFIGKFGLDKFMASYVYLTAKRLFVSPDYNMNREGWHSDGFMTDDINYIWSDCVPTVFNKSRFNLCMDDKISMDQMTWQAEPKNDVTYENNVLLRLNQYVIHKCGEITGPTMRTFFKLSISKDEYDLEGNSINYGLEYPFKNRMRKRSIDRNIPQNVK